MGKRWIVSVALTMIILACWMPVTCAASNSGDGSLDNPYQISTPEGLDNIRKNLSAHYVLVADINMSGYEMLPIGNETESPFTGSLDGNNFTVSNLEIDMASSKYVGMFGYVEGSMKNLRLKNIVISGGRYVGGLVGYLASTGDITNCSVQGTISSVGAPLAARIGGVVGFSAGKLDRLKNDGLVKIAITDMDPACSIGGLVGLVNGGSISNSNNYGTVNDDGSVSSSVGGCLGEVQNASVKNCNNSGKVSMTPNNGGAYTYGGIIGLVSGSSSISVEGCINVGPFFHHGASWYDSQKQRGGIAGLVSVDDKTNVQFVNCRNTQSLVGGGIVDSVRGGNVHIVGCRNDGNVFAGMVFRVEDGSCKKVTIQDSLNNGDFNTAGILGECTYRSNRAITIERCVNTGRGTGSNIYALGSILVNPGIVPYSINNCYNTGILNFDPIWHPSALTSYDTANSGVGVQLNAVVSSQNAVSLDELKHIYITQDWDRNIWYSDSRFNSGLPMLRNSPARLLLNEAVVILQPGESDSLIAYYDETVTSAVTYSTSNKNVAKISADGVITAVADGNATISAIMSDGTRANCHVYVITQTNSLSLKETETVAKGKTVSLKAVVDYGSAEKILWNSSDTDIATVNNGNVYGVTPGTVVITAETTLSGHADTCVVTVYAPITAISLPRTATVTIGTPLQLTATPAPADHTDYIANWTSSDENIVTVENGLLTGVNPGTATVAVTSGSGVTALCTVTVIRPAERIMLDKTSITGEVGFFENITCTIYPDDSTDSVTWSSSNVSVATVKNGVVSCLGSGSALITATAGSGVGASCVVTVLPSTILPASITISSEMLRMAIGEKQQLIASVLPSNSTNQSVAWSSSAEAIATVSDSGIVTAIAPGEAVITATAHNGVFVECDVKVAVTSSAGFAFVGGRTMPGETIEIPVYINRNPGIAAFTVKLDYDVSVMAPVAINAGELLNAGIFETNLTDENRTALRLTWYSANDLAEDGLAFTIKMRTLDMASAGDYQVGLSYETDDICNEDKATVGFSVETATIKVIDYLVGDISIDGKVGMKDIVLLCRYINDLEELSDIQLLAADVYYDGTVDVKDLVQLAQILMDQPPVAAQTVGFHAFTADKNALSGKLKIEASKPDYSGNVEITVSVSESADMAAFRFSLGSLTEYLEINNIVQSSGLSEGTFQYQYNADGVPVVLWYDSVSRSVDGEIFVIHAAVKDGTEFGDHAIDLSWDADDICNGSLNNIAITANTAVVDYAPNLLISNANMTVEGKAISVRVDFISNARSNYSAVAILGFYENGRMVETKIMSVEIHGDQATIEVTADHAFTQCKLFILESATTWIPIASATEVNS